MSQFRGLNSRTLLIALGIGTRVVLLAVGLSLFAFGMMGQAAGRLYVTATRPPAAASGAVDVTASSSSSTVGPAAGSVVSTATPERLAAYAGLGTWVDLYDTRAWRDPRGAVQDMSRRGVRTLYIETANANAKSGIVYPAQLREFISAAHASGIRVVAWYLPNLRAKSVDYARVMQAIQFTTADGQHFDSFALDIESDAVSSPSARNRGLSALTRRIRAAVGPDYPLGAIIPSPVGLTRAHGYWSGFPYESIARNYDVLLPMGYYTYHVKGAGPTYAETLENMTILRSQPGCQSIPVHMIGGIAEESSEAQVRAFAAAMNRTDCIGASQYGWPGMNSAKWAAMQSIKTSAAR